MNRNKKILLNKATKLTHVLCKYHTRVILDVENYNTYLTILGINNINWQLLHELTACCIKNKINWNVKFKDNNLVITIWK